MKKDFLKTYSKFWAEMFALSVKDLETPDFQTTSAGYYLERHQDKYIFLYQDLISGKKVLAASQEILKNLPLDSLLQGVLTDRNLAFKDIDYGISTPEEFLPTHLDKNVKIAAPKPEEIERFLKICSADDVDILDLTFENEVTQGIYGENLLVGLARYAIVRETGLADITVLIAPDYRGNRYSTPLVSRIIELSLAAGLVPKYRVDKDNLPSQAIVEKLGFKKMSTLTVWNSITS